MMCNVSLKNWGNWTSGSQKKKYLIRNGLSWWLAVKNPMLMLNVKQEAYIYVCSLVWLLFSLL